MVFGNGTNASVGVSDLESFMVIKPDGNIGLGNVEPVTKPQHREVDGYLKSVTAA